MIAEYPDHETYRALYLRYLESRDISELTRLLEPLHGTRLLDLCCGEGQLTLRALECGATSVTAVDKEEAMISRTLFEHLRVSVHIERVDGALDLLGISERLFDRVVCRQAVNYWLNENTAELLSSLMQRHGIFVFNTFNQKPSEKPRVLEYELYGHQFVEVSWAVNDTIHHVQMRDGLPAHNTTFWWLSPEHINRLLEPYFIVVEERHGRTSLYRCEKK